MTQLHPTPQLSAGFVHRRRQYLGLVGAQVSEPHSLFVAQVFVQKPASLPVAQLRQSNPAAHGCVVSTDPVQSSPSVLSSPG